MMHKIKKAATNAKAAENSEYCDYKNRLEMLSTYLRESSAALRESEKAWQEVCNQQKSFADKFANRYPDKDRVREFAKRTAGGSQQLVKEFVLKAEGAGAAHWQIDGVVHDYLKEIGDVSSEYKAVGDAAKEVSMYTKKVDDLQNSKKKVDDTKLTRNMEKLEDARDKYEMILDRVVDRMKLTYNKRAVALKATFIAYWSQQVRAFNMIDSSLDPTREFVEASVAQLAATKIRTMTEEQVAAFVEQNQAVPEARVRTPGAGTEKHTVGDDKDVVPTSPVADSDTAAEPPVANM